MHDLGKGITPPADWPRHIGHETAGTKLVTEFCSRLRVPNDYRDLGLLVARYHTHCHRAAELKPATLLDTLEALDAFRRPERVEMFVLACEADARGRTGFEAATYPQADIFRRAYAAARSVDTAAAASGGAQGPQIGEVIRRQRIDAIKRV